MSRQDEVKGLKALQSLPLQKIFQCGVSLTLLLKKEAETLLGGPWFEANPDHLLLLDLPYLERFEGILQKRPALHREGKIEDFKNLQEWEQTRDLIKTVDTVTQFLQSRVGITPRALKTMDLRDAYPEDWRQITLSTLFLTALANQILKKSFRFEIIEKSRLHDLLARMFEREKGVLTVEIRNELKDWLNAIEGDDNRRRQLLAFQDFCLDMLEEEFGKIPPGETVDPRFLKGLLISKR